MHENFKGGAITETTYFILLAVYQPNHGYGIMQFIEEKTQGRLLLGAGTLYGALNTLLEKGWIESVSGDDAKRKKQYIITAAGKEIVARELIRLRELIDLGILISEERNYE